MTSSVIIGSSIQAHELLGTNVPNTAVSINMTVSDTSYNIITRCTAVPRHSYEYNSVKSRFTCLYSHARYIAPGVVESTAVYYSSKKIREPADKLSCNTNNNYRNNKQETSLRLIILILIGFIYFVNNIMHRGSTGTMRLQLHLYCL